ncbi:FliH/SctL family protein [Pelotomaculum propionicicum]|uniref:Yop proteins translocation protein L n=1 Tax=Pelotomaculum propionicicum TaxID=258475 RepID=A0A4Y7RSB7_9FIRM|nr:FliH/SctL family protein [Pelotomaculum propionicicum]TEB11157.1 Yop proteins translocation protein L [Pelotomaculum propionicicum]
MSSSSKIIKSAEVQADFWQVLPLKAKEELTRIKKSAKKDVSATPDAGDNLQAWALAQAEETIRRASVTADEIIRHSQLDSEQIKRKAHQDGFQQGSREGYDRGYHEGMAKAVEEAEAIRARANDVLAQAEELRRAKLAELEQEIIDLAVEIAEKLLTMQLSLDREAILSVAAESLKLVADRPSVVMFVSPDELELVESKKDELKSLLPARAQLQVIADAAIEPGGCRIDTGQGGVDATMETRREALQKVLYAKDRSY